MGVEYIEVVNPIASAQAFLEAQSLAKMGLNAKILTHTRCHMSDVEAALRTGVQGVNMYMATSPILSKYSHGKGIDAVLEEARKVINFAKSSGIELRFSCEDTFRSDKTDLLRIYKAVEEMGVQRVGLADTVGVATPQEVYDTVRAVREVLRPETGIEFHTHNDTGCCIANAYVAVLAGATHIDTCVLGIGERNGITPLGGFLARMYTIDKSEIMGRYDLHLLRHLERYVAQACEISIPFNNYITGSAAFTHKAGVHSKAVMHNPGAYEVLDPADFGVERRVQLAHRLTGWNAMQHRAKSLSLDLSDDQLKAATQMIKNLADETSITMDQVDTILMQMASGPRTSSSQFVSWSSSKKEDANLPPALRKAAEDAARALEQYEKAMAAAAIQSLKKDAADSRPTMRVKLSGHLFDKAILNRAVDIVVDSRVQFLVQNLDIATVNADHSHATIKLTADKPEELQGVQRKLEALVASMDSAAECSLKIWHGDEETPIGAF
eukprot:TRINITY_DN12955_c0_g1_i1.p1 TRINITY_DN12955_c0_g1~~TRINITY_DN12955_c0_g1_i1.p1  ORF type:complete len:568 (-),score=131.73 TRINITY_DN12955_c0_g1_i1:14-1501(-)